jgi:SPP1 gp7 family putative phage head morphogenesis protein
MPRTPWPAHTEARYRAYLRRRVRALAKLLKTEVVDKGFDPTATQPRPHAPEVRVDAIDWRLAIATVLEAFARANPIPVDWLFGLVSQVDDRVRSPLLLAGIVSIPNDPKLGDWAEVNAALIRDIDAVLVADVSKLMLTAQAEGWGARTAGRELAKRTGIATRRATLIARDQISNINSQLTKQRQTDAGVREYIWRTSGDERVRDEHAAREGKRYRWSDPPPDGHPGEPILCRCTAEPVLDELEVRR